MVRPCLVPLLQILALASVSHLGCGSSDCSSQVREVRNTLPSNSARLLEKTTVQTAKDCELHCCDNERCNAILFETSKQACYVLKCPDNGPCEGKPLAGVTLSLFDSYQPKHKRQLPENEESTSSPANKAGQTSSTTKGLVLSTIKPIQSTEDSLSITNAPEAVISSTTELTPPPAAQTDTVLPRPNTSTTKAVDVSSAEISEPTPEKETVSADPESVQSQTESPATEKPAPVTATQTLTPQRTAVPLETEASTKGDNSSTITASSKQVTETSAVTSSITVPPSAQSDVIETQTAQLETQSSAVDIVTSSPSESQNSTVTTPASLTRTSETQTVNNNNTSIETQTTGPTSPETNPTQQPSETLRTASPESLVTQPSQTISPQTQSSQTVSPQTQPSQTVSPQTQSSRTESPQTQSLQTAPPPSQSSQTVSPQTQSSQTAPPPSQSSQTVSTVSPVMTSSGTEIVETGNTASEASDTSSSSPTDEITSGTTAPAEHFGEDRSTPFLTANETLADLAMEAKDRAMSAVLIAALSFGILFFAAVIVLMTKRVYDSWQRRHYSRVDYLVNGMYS